MTQVTAQIGQSTSWSSYDYGWNSFGQFLSQGAHRADRVPQGSFRSSFSETRIWLHVNQPSTIDIAGQYSFSLPSANMDVDFNMIVTDLDAGQAVYLRGFADHSFPGEPASGIFADTAQATLLPDTSYLLYYKMQILASSGPLGPVGIGSGFVHYTITPIVPQPASLFPLALSALLLPRRTR